MKLGRAKAIRWTLIPILMLLCLFDHPASGAEMHLKRRNLQAAAGEKPVLQAAGPRWGTAQRSHLILQFRQPVNDRMLQELHRRGAYVVGAVPDFGVAVSVDDGFSLEDRGPVDESTKLDVAFATRLSQDDKVSPLLVSGIVTSGDATSGDAMSRNDQGDVWVIAELFSDVNRGDAANLARASGFRIHPNRNLASFHILLSGPAENLTRLAQWDEVAYIFPASEDLIHGRRVNHCAGALSTGGVTPQFVLSGSGWPKDPSGTVTLSYVFGPITPKLDASQARQEIARALNAWTQYCPVKYVPGASAGDGKTVYVWFASGEHGDGYPFDGLGGMLAHTFYPAPPNAEPIAGDMHFDADENWHIGANTDLFTVAVHETGHALGLAHTDDPASVMYPYYRLGAKIGRDDIAGVQKLYGGPLTASPVATPVELPLTLTIAAPVAATVTAGDTIAMNGTIANGGQNLQVTWQTDHGDSGTAIGSNMIGSNIWSVAAVPLRTGSNTITVTASDASSKAVQIATVTRSASSPVTSSPDRTPPSLAITVPAASISNTAASIITVTGNASDNVGVTKVTWQTGGSTGLATGTDVWTTGPIPLLVGSNSIVIRAFDAAGNMSWRNVLVVRQ